MCTTNLLRQFFFGTPSSVCNHPLDTVASSQTRRSVTRRMAPRRRPCHDIGKCFAHARIQQDGQENSSPWASYTVVHCCCRYWRGRDAVPFSAWLRLCWYAPINSRAPRGTRQGYATRFQRTSCTFVSRLAVACLTKSKR